MVNNFLNGHLNELERIFESLNQPPVVKEEEPEDNQNLIKELLEEIENLKSQLVERSQVVVGRKDVRSSQVKCSQINQVDTNHKNLHSLMESHRLFVDQLRNEHKEVVDTLEKKIQDLKDKSKSLKKELMDLKGSIRVLCRIRPAVDKPCDLSITDTSVTVKDKAFEFDRVFDGTRSQEDVFREIEDSVESIFEGYKACLFAYGQTGSGKTHTMIGSPDDLGILGRSLERVRVMSKEMKGWEIKMKSNCLEIYNEEVVDLLGGEVEVTEDNMVEIIHRGVLRRRVGSTMSNSQSSRSHTIFILKVELSREDEKRSGALCLVDLAGSERLDKSKAEGKRLKETQNINRSLSSLGDVFTAILNKDSHIPFRNSKLTFFLQEYLTGKSRVSMILNISQDDIHYPETVCTLRFGAKVSECKLGKVTRNIIRRG